MALHESLEKEIPEALRAHDEVRLRTLRSLLTQMTNAAIAKHAVRPGEVRTFSEQIAIKTDRYLTDEEVLPVLKLAARQRKDSIELYEEGGRHDLAEAERAELAIIETYLPPPTSREEVEKIAREKLVEMKVSSKAESGKLIGAIVRELKGGADGAMVKDVVDTLLA
jgi:uncharacterized protein YqeY